MTASSKTCRRLKPSLGRRRPTVPAKPDRPSCGERFVKRLHPAQSKDLSEDLPTCSDILDELPDWGDGDGFALRPVWDEEI